MIIFNKECIKIIVSQCARHSESGTSYIKINYARVLRIVVLTMYRHGMEICDATPTEADFTAEKARTLEFFPTWIHAEKDFSGERMNALIWCRPTLKPSTTPTQLPIHHPRLYTTLSLFVRQCVACAYVMKRRGMQRTMSDKFSWKQLISVDNPG